MTITRQQVVQALDAPVTTGRLTLVAGTLTEPTAFANHTANAEVVMGRNVIGGTAGDLNWTRAGDVLTITSDNALDTSSVSYMIVG